jgi:hypothetical protein
MNTSIRLGILAAAALGGAIALGLAPAQEQGADASKELISPVQWSGPHSRIRDKRLVQIADREAWMELWAEHKGDKAERLIAHGGGVAAPRIDFERYLVVAMFRGETTNCDGESLVSLEEREKDVLLRFDSFTFQTSSFDGPDHGEPASSYGMWLVPRTGKPITIEENTQGLIGREPIWTARGTLVPPQ